MFAKIVIHSVATQHTAKGMSRTAKRHASLTKFEDADADVNVDDFDGDGDFDGGDAAACRAAAVNSRHTMATGSVTKTLLLSTASA